MSLVIVMRGERSRELVRLLRAAGHDGITSVELAQRIGIPKHGVLALIGKLKSRHGAPIENVVPWPPGRANLGRYRLADDVKVRAPKRVPKSAPGAAPCRCARLAEGKRCPSCTMRNAWASGRYRRTRPSIRPDAWEPSEDAFLASLVGKCESEMAAAFEGRFHYRRTGHAIRARMLKLGLGTRQTGWTVQALARLFGVTADRVLRAWIRPGLMAGAKGEPSRQAKLDGTREAWWRIPDAEVERFIRAYPWEYDWRTMQQGERLSMVARDVARHHSYLTTKEAGRVLGLAPDRIAALVRDGCLPAKRVTPAWGTAGREIRIAAADLVAYGRAGATL